MLLDTTFFIDLEDELRAAKPGSCATFLKEHRHLTKHVTVITIGEFAVAAPAQALWRRADRATHPVTSRTWKIHY